MTVRLLDVTAYTTFDFLDGSAVGHDWMDEAVAVLDVKTPRSDPQVVELRLELDHTDLEHVSAHADSVTLTPAQARTLANELRAYANRAEAATANEHEHD